MPAPKIVELIKNIYINRNLRTCIRETKSKKKFLSSPNPLTASKSILNKIKKKKMDNLLMICLSMKDHRKCFLNNNRILTTFQHSSSFNGLAVEKKSVKCILKIFAGVLKLGGRRGGGHEKKKILSGIEKCSESVVHSC